MSDRIRDHGPTRERQRAGRVQAVARHRGDGAHPVASAPPLSIRTLELIASLLVSPAMLAPLSAAMSRELQERIEISWLEQSFLAGVIAARSRGDGQRRPHPADELATWQLLPPWAGPAYSGALPAIPLVARRAAAAALANYSRLPSIRHLARSLGCHPVYLAREFTRATGLQVSTYLRTVKGGAAFYVVVTSDLKISAVSDGAGFGGTAAYHRWSRATTGRSPGDWREFARAERAALVSLSAARAS